LGRFPHFMAIARDATQTADSQLRLSTVTAPPNTATTPSHQFRVLIERYRTADIHRISHDFYPGGRHEMLNEVNWGEIRSNLLRWLLQCSACSCQAARKHIRPASTLRPERKQHQRLPNA
jgi:alpha-beta hydrolase superfamily lysophospholipase